MTFFKNLLLFSLVIGALSLSSCKDDDCVAPDLAENIIGVWEPLLSGGEIEFQADGTFVDPDGNFYAVEINGVDYSDKTYVVNENTITITASDPNGSGSSSADFEVTQNECDEIKISILILSETLNRK